MYMDRYYRYYLLISKLLNKAIGIISFIVLKQNGLFLLFHDQEVVRKSSIQMKNILPVK